AGQDHEGHPLLQRSVDQSVESHERGVAQCLADLRRHANQALEGRVEVEVGGVQEGEVGHGPELTSSARPLRFERKVVYEKRDFWLAEKPPMRWSRVCIESVAYQLPYERVSTRALEDRLAPAYDALGLGPGQLEALTGVRERHYWPPGTSLPAVAAQAAERALQRAGLPAAELGAVVYAGVSRDRLEPAIACAVAAILGTPPDAWLFDLSAGCLSALLAVVDLANRIELGQIRTALVVAAESARETVDETVRHLNANPSLDAFRLAVSTLDRKSVAAAIVLSDASVSRTGRRLLGGASVTAPEQHGLRFLGS